MEIPMKKVDFRKEVQTHVDGINRRMSKKTLVVAGIEPQWGRGNGSVIRVDTPHISTLSINWRDGFLGVGCDGKQTGINNWLAGRYPEQTRNSQNLRYRCNYADLPQILEYYARQPG